MDNNNPAALYLAELEFEAVATRKCLERVPFDKYDWKPHEKSMILGYLALLVGEIPKWIAYMINEKEIDFATFKHAQPKSAEELVKSFDENMEAARKALKSVSTEVMKEMFYLKNQGQVLFSSSIQDNIYQSINHLVHHRGQLTVYLRLNDVPVPSIYGPSADEKDFIH